MKIEPGHDFIHLERLENEKKVGAIHIPETAQDRRLRARVMSVGPGQWNAAGNARIPMTYKPGDIVLVPYMRGGDLSESKEKQLLVLKDSEIHGRIVEG